MPLALDGHGVDFDVQNDEAPELVEFEVHPELFGLGKFLFGVHDGSYSGMSVQPGRALNL
jgi:hypothetical protein